MSIKNSYGVSWSCGVNRSYGVNQSYGVNRSYGVNQSYGVNRSDGVNVSDGVNRSYGVNQSYGVNGSDGVNVSYGVNRSDGVNRSYGVNQSYGVLNSSGVDKAIFLADKKRSFSIFGVEVTEERFNEVWDILFKKLNGWYPKFNNAFELYMKVGNDWTKVDASKICPTLKKWDEPYEAWKDMPKGAIEYIKSLPEFNAEMFKRITGIDVGKNDEVEIIVDGKKIVISRKSAIALGLVKE